MLETIDRFLWGDPTLSVAQVSQTSHALSSDVMSKTIRQHIKVCLYVHVYHSLCHCKMGNIIGLNNSTHQAKLVVLSTFLNGD